MKWITEKPDKIFGFNTKAEAKQRHPHASHFYKVRFRFQDAWLALNWNQKTSTAKTGMLLTPDGTEIPVVWGFAQTGMVIGMRGGVCYGDREPDWRWLKQELFNAEIKNYEKTH